jgi:hypothetical protein
MVSSIFLFPHVKSHGKEGRATLMYAFKRASQFFSRSLNNVWFRSTLFMLNSLNEMLRDCPRYP